MERKKERKCIKQAIEKRSVDNGATTVYCTTKKKMSFSSPTAQKEDGAGLELHHYLQKCCLLEETIPEGSMQRRGKALVQIYHAFLPKTMRSGLLLVYQYYYYCWCYCWDLLEAVECDRLQAVHSVLLPTSIGYFRSRDKKS